MSITASAALPVCSRSRRPARRTIVSKSITPKAPSSILPVENVDLLSRYGAEQSQVDLDRLGGGNWQARKARMKSRIREIAGELIKVAAERLIARGAALQRRAGRL